MSLLLKTLIERGYFPIELPPQFSTRSFADVIEKNSRNALQTAKGKPNSSALLTYNLVRAGGLRRNLGIPNAKHFLIFSQEIISNWKEIKECAWRSSYSLTKPTLHREGRAITPEYSLDSRAEKLAELRANSRYILKADITRFFPSIYTHSIPWAYFGKKKAKTMYNSGTLHNTLPDKLDTLIRSQNNKQTIGIPIGPDTSRLIAEMILSEIDIKLRDSFPKIPGIRFIDDYEFGCYSYADAEKLLCQLEVLLNDFELELNANKTYIKKLPCELEKLWTSEFRTFSFRHSGKGQKSDLIRYFDLVFTHHNSTPDEGIIKYAIARLRSVTIHEDNIKFYENILSNCVVVEPSCLPQVCDQIVYYKQDGFNPSKTLWRQSLNSVIYERTPLGKISEATWAIWLLSIIGTKIDTKSLKLINNSDDPILALMAIGACINGLADKNKIDNLRQYTDPKYLYEKQWLLCYQSNYMNFFSTSDRKNNLRSDSFFNFLQENNVSFFSSSIEPPTPPRTKLPNTDGTGGSY